MAENRRTVYVGRDHRGRFTAPRRPPGGRLRSYVLTMVILLIGITILNASVPGVMETAVNIAGWVLGILSAVLGAVVVLFVIGLVVGGAHERREQRAREAERDAAAERERLVTATETQRQWAIEHGLWETAVLWGQVQGMRKRVGEMDAPVDSHRIVD